MVELLEFCDGLDVDIKARKDWSTSPMISVSATQSVELQLTKGKPTGTKCYLGGGKDQKILPW